jgi:hypothetical protein
MNNEKETQIAWTICNLIEKLNDLIWNRYENEFIDRYLQLEEEKYWQSQLDDDPLWDIEQKP